MPRQTVYVSYDNHFDLIWRRGWERRYELEGKLWRSYADIEEAVISRWVRLALTDGCAFGLEQALSLRKYLERHPEQAPVFRDLAQQGRFLLQGAGEAIIDINMCSGETVARNLASGLDYAQRLLGVGALCAHHGDGFGSCAQFPQIIRRCGLKGVIGLSYLRPDAPYWRGLDGSIVLTDFPIPGGGGFHDHCYFTPCTACLGHGTLGLVACAACDGTGLDLTNCHYPHWDWPALSDSPFATFGLTSEEMLPDADLPRRVRERNAAQSDQRYVWGTMRMYFEHFAGRLAAVDHPPAGQISSRTENNPVMTGCYVSRIKVKQRARAAEARFYAAEILMSLAQMRDGRPACDAMQAAWLRLPLLFFHDAVTGSHNDPAYWELLDMADEVERTADAVTIDSMQRHSPQVRPLTPLSAATTVSVFNSLSFARTEWVALALDAKWGGGCRVTDAAGNEMPVYADGAYGEPAFGYPNPKQPIMPVGPGRAARRTPALLFLARDIPPMSTASFTITPGAAAASVPVDCISNERYAVKWDDQGVTSIHDKLLGQELVGGDTGLRAGELILERDQGDPWGTRSLERPRVHLGPQTRCLGGRRYGRAQEVRFAGVLDNNPYGSEKIPEIRGVYWYQTVRLYEGLRVEFDLEVFWETKNQRIRVAFPTRAASDTGIYSTPYGLVKRDRYEMTETKLWSPNGDWPAAEFVGTLAGPDAPGVAVVNLGTPAARIEDGVILYSVLRSPGFGFAQSLYAWDYPMPLERLADGGFHRFRFALMSYRAEPVEEGVLDQALSMTTPMLAWRGETALHGFSVEVGGEGAGVYLTALKPTFAGDGWALRVVEYAGRSVEATITLPSDGWRVESANLVEQERAGLNIDGRRVKIWLKPHEIATLVVTRASS